MRFAALAVAALATGAIAHPGSITPVLARSSLLTDIVNILDPAPALQGLSCEGAAAFVGAGLGLEAGLISTKARSDLDSWLDGASADLDAGVITAVKGWCSGSSSASLSVDVVAEISLLVPYAISIAAEGDLKVELTGIEHIGTVAGVILEASLQTALEAFISANADIDADVKIALGICAAGGVVSTLTVDVKDAITAFLSSSECTLSADLKAAIRLWLSATEGAGVTVIGAVSKAVSLIGSIGASVEVAVDDVTGILSASYISALQAWISAQSDIDVDIKGWLDICAAGKAAIEIDVDAVAKLTAWLFDSSCTLSAELKAVVLYWLHVRLAVSDTVSVLTSTDIDTLTAWFTADISSELSAACRGAIAVAISGEAVVNVSVEAIAELVAVISGLVSGIDISVDIQIILGQWISGEACGCH